MWICGHLQLQQALRAAAPAEASLGWVCNLWETGVSRAYLASPDEDSFGRLEELRVTLLGARAAAPRCNYQISADKAIFSAWSGVDVGPCRPPLPSLSAAAVAPALQRMRELGVVDAPPMAPPAASA